MKKPNIIYTLLTAGVLLGGLTACESEKEGGKEDEAKLAAEAKVAKTDAEKTALAKVPNGTIKESELEKEKGKLIWSFDITIPDSKDIKEVNVDAITGEVVGPVETETPEQQAKEADEDAKKEKKDKD